MSQSSAGLGQVADGSQGSTALELAINSQQIKYSQEAGKRFAEDVIGRPNASQLDIKSAEFATEFARCQEIDKRGQPTDKHEAMMQFGTAVVQKQLGGRSRKMADMLICLTNTTPEYLCNPDFKKSYNKLVKKFMKSDSASGLGMKMAQANYKKQLAEMEPARREMYMRRNETGEYDPGYMHLKKLFTFGYLQTADFSGWFSTPKWASKLGELQGSHEEACRAA